MHTLTHAHSHAHSCPPTTPPPTLQGSSWPLLSSSYWRKRYYIYIFFLSDISRLFPFSTAVQFCSADKFLSVSVDASLIFCLSPCCSTSARLNVSFSIIYLPIYLTITLSSYLTLYIYPSLTFQNITKIFQTNLHKVHFLSLSPMWFIYFNPENGCL